MLRSDETTVRYVSRDLEDRELTASEVDRLAIVAARLPVKEWPSVSLRIVAVNMPPVRR